MGEAHAKSLSLASSDPYVRWSIVFVLDLVHLVLVAFTSDDFVKRREPHSKLCIHAFVLLISFYHHYQCYLLSLSPMLFP